MKTYIFKVRKIQNINIERIEEEVQKDNPYAIGFILAINDDDDNALYLYEEFLDLWSGSNAPEICGERLDLSWGFSHNGLSHNGLLECKKTRVRSFKKEELSQIIEELKNLQHPTSYKVKVISIPL